MGVKYYDTREGWLARGYKLTPGNSPVGTTLQGFYLYSWGQVEPISEQARHEVLNGVETGEATNRKGRHLEGVEELTSGKSK